MFKTIMNVQNIHCFECSKQSHLSNVSKTARSVRTVFLTQHAISHALEELLKNYTQTVKEFLLKHLETIMALPVDNSNTLHAL